MFDAMLKEAWVEGFFVGAAVMGAICFFSDLMEWLNKKVKSREPS